MEVCDCFGGGSEEGDLEFGGGCLEDRVETSWWEWRFLHSWLRGYEELLVVDWNIQDTRDLG